jgi:hypothetical protein
MPSIFPSTALSGGSHVILVVPRVETLGFYEACCPFGTRLWAIRTRLAEEAALRGIVSSEHGSPGGSPTEGSSAPILGRRTGGLQSPAAVIGIAKGLRQRLRPKFSGLTTSRLENDGDYRGTAAAGDSPPIGASTSQGGA